MCPGLKVGPAYFNHLIIQRIFADVAWETLYPFFDDITYPSRDFTTGLEGLKLVFSRLQAAGLKLKPAKCRLLQESVKILGVIVTQNSLSVDPQRTEALMKIAYPKTKRELRSLLGALNFARQFYKNFAELCAPLTAMLRKGGKVVCNEETMAAFQRIRSLICNPPALAMYDTQAERLIVETDSSNTSTGAVLKQQSKNGEISIVAYYSQVLNNA